MGGADDARIARQQQTKAARAHEAVRASKAAVDAVELMRVHRYDAAQQKKGCATLSAFANVDAKRTAIAAAGGVGCVVAAMRAHADAVDVQQGGCHALGNLADNHAANQAAIAAAGGIGCVVAAMRAHADAAGVQQWGCHALGILADNLYQTAPG